MEVFAGLSVGVLILTALLVVIKTLALWRRTHGLPELLLSLYLSCATVIGYPLAIITSRVAASEYWPVYILAEAIMAVGWVSLLFFTLKVFRRDASWARWLVGFAVSLVAASVGAYVLVMSGAHPRPAQQMPGLTTIASIPAAIGYFWTTFEALAYHRRLRLRRRLGLADNAVTNRMLLWGLMALAAGAALVINMAALLGGSYLSPPIVVISSILGLFHAGCLFLAFHAPAWYRRWLESSEPVAAA